MRRHALTRLWSRGQTVIEYCVMIMVIIGALIASQVYFKRGIQGRWKSAVDEMSQDFYDPDYTISNMIYRTVSNSLVNIWSERNAVSNKIWTRRRDETKVTDSRTGNIKIGAQ